MSEFLLELFSEEIPARFQRQAANYLQKTVTNELVEAGLSYKSAKAFVTPRRLSLIIDGLPHSSPDIKEEKRGPRVGAPEQAIEGFLRSCGLDSVQDLTIKTDAKKGDYYIALIKKKGVASKQILSEILPRIINNFSWPKSMRWGSGKLSWVRPLRSILAIFYDEEKSEIIDFEIDGLRAGNMSYGHRFLAPKVFEVKNFENYKQSLNNANVVLDIDKRKQIIKEEANQLAFAQGLKLIEDENLLEEVAGLIEWPNIMMGRFEKEFLKLPREVIITTIKNNQKCFCLENERGELSDKFILVSNMIAQDGGKTIISGNERVIGARLSDALFFYENDIKIPLERRVAKLNEIVFHAKLGTQFDRVKRISDLACEIGAQIGADIELTKRAAKLAKADLVSEMVYEFASLQGIMGRYYALAQGEDEKVANAIEKHYKPLGPNDEIPKEPVAIALALADKLDLLQQFWAIDEKPTGSRDPFALRRAALGIIRILVENKIDFALQIEPDLLKFFHERLKVMLREKGARHDLVDAVIFDNSNNMLEIVQRVEALSNLLETKAGENLLAGYRRATNILRAEEKKDKIIYSGNIDKNLLFADKEKELYQAIMGCYGEVEQNIKRDDYKAAIKSLANLQAPVDDFFENILVNDEDEQIRKNRLNLLAKLRELMHKLADFSKIEG